MSDGLPSGDDLVSLAEETGRRPPATTERAARVVPLGVAITRTPTGVVIFFPLDAGESPGHFAQRIADAATVLRKARGGP